jgi:hypothetical protein
MLDRPHPTPEAPTNDCFALARALSGHHFIGGRYVPALSGKTFAVVNPATGQEIGRAADGDAADVERFEFHNMVVRLGGLHAGRTVKVAFDGEVTRLRDIREVFSGTGAAGSGLASCGAGAGGWTPGTFSAAANCTGVISPRPICNSKSSALGK